MSELLDQANEAAYLIRAHHLQILMSVDAGDSSTAAAHNLALSAEVGIYEMEDLSILDGDSYPGDLDYQEFTSAYRMDILGPNDQNAPLFRSASQKMLERYVRLRDHDPVIIGINVLDGICSGCAFQRHCRNISPNRTITDRSTLEVFSYIAGDLGYSEHLKRTDTSIETNGQTTKAVVRQLNTKSSSFDRAITNFRWKGSPYDDSSSDF